MIGTYNPWLVAFSVLVAVYVSYTALNLAARMARNADSDSANLWLAGGAVAMGCGIWSMHFIGMLAFSLPIALSYDVFLTAGSLVIAIGASFAALWLFFRLREGHSVAMRAARLGAAFVMGLAISGMHYTGMAASQFSAKAVCISNGTVDTRWLAMATGVVAIGVLSVTTLLLFLDSHRHALARKPA
jgi:diguanylate cyclase